MRSDTEAEECAVHTTPLGNAEVYYPAGAQRSLEADIQLARRTSFLHLHDNRTSHIVIVRRWQTAAGRIKAIKQQT